MLSAGPEAAMLEHRRRLVLIAHIGVVLAVLASWLVVGYASDSEALVWPLSVECLAVVIWLFVSWTLAGRPLFDPYAIFLLAGVLFNAGQICLEAFGLNRLGILDGDFPAPLILQSIALVTGGLAGLHLGALAAVAVPWEGTAGLTRRVALPSSWSCRVVGLGLLLVAGGPALAVARARLATVYESGYYALYQQQAATGGNGAAGNILAAFIAPAALFLLAGSGPRRLLRRLSLGVVCLYAAVQLFSGARGHAAMLGVSYAWLWHRSVRPLPRTALLAAGAISLFVLFPLLAEVRNISGVDRLGVEFLRQTYLSIDNPVLSILSEMGGSLLTVAYTIELVPARHAFDMGVGYLYALTPAIPSFFWDVHPVIARGTPSDWLIWTVDPFTARLGGGLGYSFIAEAYLNFGWLGTPIFTTIAGFLFCRFVLWADRFDSPARLAAIAAFTSFTLFYARGEASTLMRPFLWYALLPYAACRLTDTLAAMRSATPVRDDAAWAGRS